MKGRLNQDSVGPTAEQEQKISELQDQGYVFDEHHSVAAAGVVLKQADGDFWFFGLDGEIMHNPEGLTIALK